MGNPHSVDKSRTPERVILYMTSRKKLREGYLSMARFSAHPCETGAGRMRGHTVNNGLVWYSLLSFKSNSLSDYVQWEFDYLKNPVVDRSKHARSSNVC